MDCLFDLGNHPRPEVLDTCSVSLYHLTYVQCIIVSPNICAVYHYIT